MREIIKTGIATLDEALAGGLRRGSVTLLLSHSGNNVGRECSTLLAQVCKNVALARAGGVQLTVFDKKREAIRRRFRRLRIDAHLRREPDDLRRILDGAILSAYAHHGHVHLIALDGDGHKEMDYLQWFARRYDVAIAIALPAVLSFNTKCEHSADAALWLSRRIVQDGTYRLHCSKNRHGREMVRRAFYLKLTKTGFVESEGE